MKWFKKIFNVSDESEKKSDDFIQKHFETESKAEQAASINGKHYIGYAETVKQLKREKKHNEVIDLLKKLIKAVEDEGKVYRSNGRDWFIAPWYYEQLAIVYRKEKRYDDEVAILERHQEQNNGEGSTKLAERLKKAIILRDKRE